MTKCNYYLIEVGEKELSLPQLRTELKKKKYGLDQDCFVSIRKLSDPEAAAFNLVQGLTQNMEDMLAADKWCRDG